MDQRDQIGRFSARLEKIICDREQSPDQEEPDCIAAPDNALGSPKSVALEDWKEVTITTTLMMPMQTAFLENARPEAVDDDEADITPASLEATPLVMPTDYRLELTSPSLPEE